MDYLQTKLMNGNECMSGHAPTRHFTDTFTDAPTHPDDADLTERVLVEPLHDKFARVLQGEVKPSRTHVTVHHRRRQIEEEDEMPDDGPSNGRSRCEQSSEHGEERNRR